MPKLTHLRAKNETDNFDHAKIQSKPEAENHNFPLIFRCSGQYVLQYSDSFSLRISPAAR